MKNLQTVYAQKGNYSIIIKKYTTELSKSRGYSTPGPYFGRLCAFAQKIKLWLKYPMDLVRSVPRKLKNHSFTSTETIVVKWQ